MHKATLILKLEFFQFVKIFTHNQALYHPLQRQAGQSEISRRAFSANIEMILPVRAWTKWCRNLAKPGAIPKKAALRVVQDGKRVRALTKSSKAVSASVSLEDIHSERQETSPSPTATQKRSHAADSIPSAKCVSDNSPWPSVQEDLDH